MVKEADPGATLGAASVMDTIEDVHGAIEKALKARSEYMVQESATMTLQKMRRLLEKDLNVEQGFLDPHKEFIKDLINKLLMATEAENPETTQETEVEPEKSIKEPEVEDSAAAEEEEKPKMKRLKKKTDSEGVKDEVTKPQDSDAGVKPSTDEEGVKKPEADSPSDSKEEENLESSIAEAIRKRAPHFKDQAESLTLQGVRRLLEQDLSMEKGALDAHKTYIAVVLDQVLNAEDEEPVPVTNAKKRKAAATESKKKSNKSSKKQKAASSEELVENASSEGERAPKVRNGANRKSTKKKKVVQEEDEDASGDDDGDNDVEPSKEDSSGVEDSDDPETEHKKVSKPKKVVESKPVYGRKVELLKGIIKACGITVPPNVYRKAKQASEERREGVLIKELEGILSKEGLTASASKDEIKAVRKRKEKLKDLEGIDTSNIIGESRGRRSRSSANSFFAPQRTEPVHLGDEDEDEDEDEEEEQESDSEEDPNVELQDDDDED